VWIELVVVEVEAMVVDVVVRAPMAVGGIDVKNMSRNMRVKGAIQTLGCGMGGSGGGVAPS